MSQKKTPNVSVTSSGRTAPVCSGDANLPIVCLENAKGKNNRSLKNHLVSLNYRKKLALSSHLLRPSSMLPPHLLHNHRQLASAHPTPVTQL